MTKDCLTDEMIACYAEGILQGSELTAVEVHLKQCALCAQVVEVQKECVLARKRGEFSYVDPELFERLRKELIDTPSVAFLNIVLTFKEKIIDAIRTTGEILPLSPAYALRGESETGHTVVIRETFSNVEIIVEITKQAQESFRVLLKTTDLTTSMPKDDLRINLIEGETELESYKTLGGRAVFDSLKMGEYVLQVMQKDQIVGNVRLNIKSA